MKKNSRPVIGVTLDYSNKPTYAKTPWYAIRENYIESLVNYNANILLLHYQYLDIDLLVNGLDGLVITGGDFDIPPELYGQTIKHESVVPNVKRSNFEYQVCKLAIAKKIPVLGICGGHQLINVVMGGTLIQHIPQEVTSSISHQQELPKHIPSHPVNIVKETFLHKLLGKESISVNSSHHQAIKIVAPSLKVNAVANDGIIEGVELNSKDQYVLGVQWHPEYCTTNEDKKIIQNFMEECHKLTIQK